MTFYTATGAAGAAVTLTMAAVGTAQYQISWLLVTMYNTAARTGGVTPVNVTTSNLNGLRFDFPSAGAVGTMADQRIEPANALAAQATGAVTIVCPATASVIWTVNCWAVP